MGSGSKIAESDSVPKSHELLSPSEFVAGVKGHELSEILGAAAVRKVAAQKIIVRQDTRPTHLFLLRSGGARFFRLTPNGEEILLATLVPGDVFGLSNLLARPEPYIGTAETTRNSELLVWDQVRIRRLAQKYPRLAQNALAVALRYLAAHFDRLVNLVTCNAAERLAQGLLHLCRKAGQITPLGVEIAVTNEELAAEANLSLFTVSRILSNWARQGVLSRSRGKVFIQSPHKLVRR
jgi:CRP-like cAMP-binding protein